jgi:hypothetical protein
MDAKLGKKVNRIKHRIKLKEMKFMRRMVKYT